MNYLKTFVILNSKILRYRRSCKAMYDHHIRIEPFEYMTEFKIYGRRKEKLVKPVHKLLPRNFYVVTTGIDLSCLQ